MKITKQASCPRLSPVTSYVPMRPNWPTKPEKILPHKVPYPMRPYQPPQVQGQQPGNSRQPGPRPAVTRDPFWYQTETEPTKPWKPVTSRPLSPPPQPSGSRDLQVAALPFSCFLILAVVWSSRQC
jgi:hypothetical protein